MLSTAYPAFQDGGKDHTSDDDAQHGVQAGHPPPATVAGRGDDRLLTHDRAATAAVSLGFGAIFLLKGVTTLL